MPSQAEHELEWSYAESLKRDRVEKLLGWSSFDEIATRVARARIVGFCWETFSGNRLRGCARASFTLEVPKCVYDAFFNAPCGYRAEYARCVARGEAANKRLVSSMRERLVDYAAVAKSVILGRTSPSRIHRSLLAASAKIWIYESASIMAHVETVGNEILQPVWATAPNGYGQRAPEGTLLEMKGAWLNSMDGEVIDPWKEFRGDDIHLTGWT